MNRFEKLFDIKLYKWLLKLAKPYLIPILLITLFNIFTSLSGVLNALISKQVLDSALKYGLRQSITYIVIFGLLSVFRIVMTAIISWVITKTSETMSYGLHKYLLGQIYKIEWLKLNKYHSGDILTRFSSDTGNVISAWVNIFPTIVSLSFQLVAAFVMLLYYDKTLAFFAFVIGPLSSFMSWFLGRKLKQMQHALQQAESKYRSYLQEIIQNILIVKTFCYEKRSLIHVSELQKNKFNLAMKRSNFGIKITSLTDLGFSIGFFLAFVWGAFRISLGLVTFGTFTAFIQLIGQIQAPFYGLFRSLPQVSATFASAERLIEIENLEMESKSEIKNINRLIDKHDFIGISFENIKFSYDNKKYILNDLTMKINSGEFIALIGASGEGKTTIIRILLALLTPNSGNALLTKKNNRIDKISVSSREYFSYVPQGNTLFSGSIQDNLLIGNPNATKYELIAALKAACIWELIETLPDGLDTIVGEKGVGLSEGQVQRLGIARAILKKAPILLLDEATSALDMETERKVFINIRNLLPKRTCIAITHRLSVLTSCDSVYRLENGTVYKLNTGELKSVFAL